MLKSHLQIRMKILVTQLCLTLWDPMNHRPPGSSVHGILQARIPEWVAIPFFRGSSRPRGQSLVSCIAGIFFTIWTTSDQTCLQLSCRAWEHSSLWKQFSLLLYMNDFFTTLGTNMRNSAASQFVQKSTHLCIGVCLCVFCILVCIRFNLRFEEKLETFYCDNVNLHLSNGLSLSSFHLLGIL